MWCGVYCVWLHPFLASRALLNVSDILSFVLPDVSAEFTIQFSSYDNALSVILFLLPHSRDGPLSLHPKLSPPPSQKSSLSTLFHLTSHPFHLFLCCSRLVCLSLSLHRHILERKSHSLVPHPHLHCCSHLPLVSRASVLSYLPSPMPLFHPVLFCSVMPLRTWTRCRPI